MRHILQERRGVVALEFALVAPVLILFSIGVFDLTRALIVREQVWNAVRSIASSASSLAVQPDQSTSLTVAQVQQALSGIFAAIPWLRSGALTGQTSVVLSSVNFVQTTASCTATTTNPCPQLVWSVAYAGRGPASFLTTTRSCATPPLVVATVTDFVSSLTSLPVSNIADPSPMLVVDVSYQFTPMFFSFLSGPINFWATSYWPIRSANPNATSGDRYTRYDILKQGPGVGKCPGFS